MSNPAKELTIGHGQIACKLTVLREVFPPDLLVSHFDADMKVWKVDSALGDFRVADPSKLVAFRKALDHMLHKRGLQQGRPRRQKKTTTIRLTDAVKLYGNTLCATMGVDLSTLIAYLICVAHAAYMDNVAQGSTNKQLMEPDEEDLTDEVAFIEVLKQDTFAGDLEQARKRDVMREYQEKSEEEMTQMAQLIRGQIDKEQKEKKVSMEIRINKARKSEKRADEKLKRLDNAGS